MSAFKSYIPLFQLSQNLRAISLSIILHLVILGLLILNLDGKFVAQQAINIQLNASISSNSHSAPSESNNTQSKNSKSNQFNNKNAVESEVVYNAQYLNNPAPLYPPLAKSRNIEGKVVLEVLVSDQGEALKVKIISSSGSTLLDDSAYDAVKNWKFIPAQKFGKNVDATILIPIEFKIVN